MNELSLERMEEIKGGNYWDCAGTALGLISLGFAIASVPVTGPIGFGLIVGLTTGTLSTGISGGSCLYGFIDY